MRPQALVAGLAILGAPAVPAQETGGGPGLTNPPPGVSLTGRWVIDLALSDNPDEKVQDAMKGLQSDRDDRGGHRGPTFPVYPGPGGITDQGEGQAPTGPGIDVTTPGVTGTVPTGDPFARGGSPGSSRSQARGAFDYVLDLPEVLTIAQRPSLILIQEDDDEGRTRALRPDGARVQSAGGDSESRTRWDKGLLYVDTWHDDGVHVEEIFDLAPDRSLLTVSVRANDGGSAIALERVFRLDESAQG